MTIITSNFDYILNLLGIIQQLDKLYMFVMIILSLPRDSITTGSRQLILTNSIPDKCHIHDCQSDGSGICSCSPTSSSSCSWIRPQLINWCVIESVHERGSSFVCDMLISYKSASLSILCRLQMDVHLLKLERILDLLWCDVLNGRSTSWHNMESLSYRSASLSILGREPLQMDVQLMLEDDAMYYSAVPHSGISSIRRRRMFDAV